MAKEIVVPDYLKDLVDESQVQSEFLISSAESVPRISLKGGRFRLIEDGEVIEKINDEMHIVILGVQPERAMAKTYYKGKYNPDDSSPPDCSSNNGVTPDMWVSNPQNDKCQGCEQNAWGSAVALSGGKAKACRDSKRLMVVKAQDIMGIIYILNVTVSSLKNLSAYGKLLVQHSVPMAAAITTISFDDDSDFPKLEFEFMGCLKEKHGTKALVRSGEKEWDTFPQQALTHDSNDDETKRITLEQDEEEDEEETEAQKVKRMKKEIKKAELKMKAEHADDEEDEDDPVRIKRAKAAAKKKAAKEEEEDDDDASPMSDVDDLLDGWEDED
jgi:hypothetical protein